MFICYLNGDSNQAFAKKIIDITGTGDRNTMKKLCKNEGAVIEFLMRHPCENILKFYAQWRETKYTFINISEVCDRDLGI